MTLPQVLCLLFFLVVGIVVVIAANRSRRAFEERFPPLSDAEFVALCPPGTDPEVALRVRRIVANNLAVDYELIYPSTNFIEDLGAD